MIVVEVWLVYSGRHGIRTGTDQHELYEQLADQLIDNSFDSVGLRDRPSDLVTSGVTPRRGIGAQLTPTKKQHKSKSGTSITFALQRQLTFAPLASMTALRADRPGFFNRNNRHCSSLHLQTHHS
jgi:hypothetical protein